MQKRKNRSPILKNRLRTLIIIFIGMVLVNCKAPSSMVEPLSKDVKVAGKGGEKVKKPKDRDPPFAAMTLPNDGATNVPVGTNIVILVQDTVSGVDLSTIVMTVDGNVVYDGANPTQYSQTTNYGVTSVSGNPSKYTLIYDPQKNFNYLQVVKVTIKTSDISGNVMALDTYSFMTGIITCQAGDSDCDGILDTDEDVNKNGTVDFGETDPNRRTLFVRPKRETGGYWAEFIQLFPDARPGFADIPPFTNAKNSRGQGIEISVIGPDNQFVPMKNVDYDPADPILNPKNLPCDILEIVYRDGVDLVTGTPSYCGAGNNNYGHTYFSSIGRTWYWDTKGYTPNNTGINDPKTKYGYFGVDIYPFAVDNYFAEGAYQSIALGIGAEAPPSGDPCPFNPYKLGQCYFFNYSSPMNLNASDPVGGLPDGDVEFNAFGFYADKTIGAEGAQGTGYEKPDVFRRVIAHEMGHAILAASQFDHCADSQCILYGNSVDWKMHEFGPGSCFHSPGGSKDIRADGIIHNTIH